MRKAAASAAIHMPQLRTMEIWNGQERFAALFRNDVISGTQRYVITWRSTWDITIQRLIILT